MVSQNFRFRGLFFLMVMIASSAFAQDIHFTQFYATPLTLNPALTGKTNGGYRLAAIYRAQGRSITGDPKFNAYSTPAASFDIPFIFGKTRTNAIGTGLVIVNDLTNQKRLNTLQLQLSVAYHKSLDKNYNHQLSIGLQGGIQQKTVKTGEFTYADQFDQNGNLDPDLTSAENKGDVSKTIPDFNTGLFYSGRLFKKFTLFTGFSIFHLGSPNESLTEGREAKLPMRYAVHGGVDWRIGERFSLLPGVIWMTQAKAREINFGTNVGLDLIKTPNREATLYLGAWYRVEDAVSPMLAVELLKRFRVGFSYDVTTSDLADATERKGGFEISLSYVGQILRVQEVNLFCPRF